MTRKTDHILASIKRISKTTSTETSSDIQLQQLLEIILQHRNAKKNKRSSRFRCIGLKFGVRTLAAGAFPINRMFLRISAAIKLFARPAGGRRAFNFAHYTESTIKLAPFSAAANSPAAFDYPADTNNP